MSKAPIFQDIFGVPWASLPPVMQKHYAIRPDSADRVAVTGVMDVKCGWPIKLLSPLLRFIGTLAPWDGQGVPATVIFYSGPQSSDFHFDRLFYFPGKKPFRFHSRLIRIEGNDVVEVMRFGFGWRAHYSARGNQVFLEHIGYCLKLGRMFISLPMLTWMLGKGAAAEEALSDNSFKMWMTITHPLWGEVYRYQGSFEIAEVANG